MSLLRFASKRAMTSSSPAARLSLISRHLNSSSPSDTGAPNTINNITVFGAGLMGSGIAQVAAQAGLNVTMCDLSSSALENGRKIIQSSLTRIAAKRPELGGSAEKQEAWIQDVLSRVRDTTDGGEGVGKADLVVEAVVESMKTKQSLFSFLDSKAPPSCIFASNTSSLPISEISESVSDDRRKKFAGLHFFNPVPAMKLVEIISTERTGQDTTDALFVLCETLGKTAVGCKDTPGFIVNRLLVPYMLEAIRMVERGEATPKDIDSAMKLGAGYPMGPFELLDFVGLDTTSFIANGWKDRVAASPSSENLGLSPDLVKPIPLLDEMVKEGKLGRKSGEKGGFYTYDARGRPVLK